MIEFVQVYGGPASTLIGAATVVYMVVWEVETVNKDVNAYISRIKREFYGEISRIERKMDANNSDILIAVRAAAGGYGLFVCL